MVRGSVLGWARCSRHLIAFGPEAAFAARARVRRRSGGTMRIGGIIPDGSLEPPLLQSLGALGVSHASPGEQLVYADKNAVLRPHARDRLEAVQRREDVDLPAAQGRQVPRRHAVTADDVVATFKRLPSRRTRRRCSSYKGVLSPGGATKVDASTGQVRPRRSPTASSRTCSAQMTYQAIMLPKTLPAARRTSRSRASGRRKMNGTGPVQAEGEPRRRPGSHVRRQPEPTGAASRRSTRSSIRSSRTRRA